MNVAVDGVTTVIVVNVFGCVIVIVFVFCVIAVEIVVVELILLRGEVSRGTELTWSFLEKHHHFHAVPGKLTRQQEQL